MDDGRLPHRHKHWRLPRTTVHHHNVAIWVCHHDDLGCHHGVAMQCCDIASPHHHGYQAFDCARRRSALLSALQHLAILKICATLPVVQKLVCAPCLKHSMLDSMPQDPATSRGGAPPERLTATFTASRGAAPPPPRPAPPPTRKRAAPGPGATGHGGTML